MKYIFFFFLITLIACSTTKQLTKKWVGKTDQDVVNEYGLPETVLNDTLKGKIYKYGNAVNKIIGISTVKYINSIESEVVNHKSLPITFKTIYFDSLNRVTKIYEVDSIVLTKGNAYPVKIGQRVKEKFNN